MLFQASISKIFTLEVYKIHSEAVYEVSTLTCVTFTVRF